MTVKMVEELYCDRCKQQFWRRPEVYRGAFYTMQLAYMILDNGSGTHVSDPNRSRMDYDYDLCDECTTEFRKWWGSGKK